MTLTDMHDILTAPLDSSVIPPADLLEQPPGILCCHLKEAGPSTVHACAG
ncbi:MAG TPA: hypothetical protein VGX23_24245 [Actinocrinis sp.]|nr:hypothetical protein [Actinocrinis sp.]